ncbi:MAG: AfsR/SARP family transcriptional regulator, partial [Acidimicrobiales bacterium]
EHWIYPGWVLVMPADAEGAVVVGAAQPVNGPLPAHFPPPAAGPVATPTTTGPVTPSTPPTTAVPATTGGETTAPSPSPPTMVALSAERVRGGSGIEVSTLVQAGLVGAAVVGTIELLRRRQAQRRPAGRRIRIPEPDLAKAELVVARSSQPDRVALVERAVVSLVRALRDKGATSPTILGVLVNAEWVEIMLDAPASAPAPWESSAEGFRWRIGVENLGDHRPLESTGLPALVSLGRVAMGSADALINLEAAGLVGVSGDPANALGMLYAMAAHLQGAPWTRACNVVFIGLPPELSTAAHVRSVASMREVTDELRATAAVMAETTRTNGCHDAFAGRVRGLAGDGWPPTIVVSAHHHNPDELRLLAAIVRPGSGVAAVVLGGHGIANWEIDASARPCPVNPLRVAIEPIILDDHARTAVAELIHLASDTSGATRDDPPYDQIELSVDNPTVAAAAESAVSSRPPAAAVDGVSIAVRLNGNANSAHPPPDMAHSPVVIKVLGSVEIDGAAEFKRAKSRELAVYLAMHPGGVGESELDEALWGSSGARLVAASTRDATVSVARTALGGPARLLPAQGQGREKRYQLGPDVTSDWARFCTLVRYGREHQSVGAIRDALELVRGRPFQAVVSGRTYSWLHTEGHVRHIEAEVADTADLASGLYLEAGDPLNAKWAARRGLVAEPYTERLWVRLMEAADALGESQEIERIMDEMDAVLELEGDFSGLHPNTLAAYDRLSRRHRHPADI